jgi:DNA-binding response OmpR family regulator
MKKVLIIENGKSIKNMMDILFKKEGYKIFLSKDLTKRSGLRENFYDLIIADLTSIKKEKVELLMQLKDSSFSSPVPFLLITSQNGAGIENHFSLFNHYLTKPFTYEDFSAIVKRIFDNIENISPW